MDGGPGGCWEKHKPPAYVAWKRRSYWWCRYLPHLEESGVAAQVAETRQQQMLHCVLAQHCDNFTHDLWRKTHGRQREEKHHMAFRSSTAGHVCEPPPKYNVDALWLPVSMNQTGSIDEVVLLSLQWTANIWLWAHDLTSHFKCYEGVKNRNPKGCDTSEVISSWCNE